MKTLIVDDHPLVRNGIASLLAARGHEVVGEANSGEDALSKAKDLNPEVVLMDVRMPNMNGIEATRLLKAQAPEIRVVMLTVSDDERDLFDTVKAGAQGYLLKDLEGDSFIDSLEAIERGEAVVPTQMSRNLFDEFRTQSRRLDYGTANGQQLSSREHEVVTHVAEGITNRAVGIRMEISENTVKFHMKNILAKLRLQNRAQLVAWAAARGMVKEPEPSR